MNVKIVLKWDYRLVVPFFLCNFASEIKDINLIKQYYRYDEQHLQNEINQKHLSQPI